MPGTSYCDCHVQTLAAPDAGVLSTVCGSEFIALVRSWEVEMDEKGRQEMRESFDMFDVAGNGHIPMASLGPSMLMQLRCCLAGSCCCASTKAEAPPCCSNVACGVTDASGVFGRALAGPWV